MFGGVEDLIKDKHLLLVPSGPLDTTPVPSFSHRAFSWIRGAVSTFFRNGLAAIVKVGKLCSLPDTA